MNTASTSESGSYSTNNTRPFFYAHPTTQQPFPNPWYLSHAYNPYYVPASGFRSGNPYFPCYSVALHEYPGFFVPQHPVHARINRRPYFNVPPPSPMFYHATRFRHYSTPGKKMETKETQTDPRQPENKQKRHQDIRMETKGCDAGNMACVSSGIGTETESISEKQDSSGSSIAVDREFPNKSPSNSTQYRNLPTGSYAFEKEEVRIEYGNGSPAIQLWKSFKETIPLYDVASGKPVPDNIVQRDLFSVSSCEGMLYSPHEGEKRVPGAYLDERKAVLASKQGVETVQEKEVKSNEVHLDAEKQVNTSQWGKSPPGEAMVVQMAELSRSVSMDEPVVRQDVAAAKKSSSKKSTSSKTSQEEPSSSQQAGQFPSSIEVMSDLSFQQKRLNLSHNVTTESQTDRSIWCEESIEKYVPPSSWLACLDSMDANYNYNVCLPQRKRRSVLSISSDDMSSREEGSSIDNAPVSFFVPDCVLQKSMYTFQKSTEGLEKEKIKSGGSLNEDEVVGREQVNSLNDQDAKNSSTVKTKEASCKGKKLAPLPRSSSYKKIDSLKKKTAKSLSEVEDSEEYPVKGEEDDEDGEENDNEEEEEEEDDDDDNMDEIEYFFEEATPFGILTSSKGSFYQVGQRLLWKPPKNVIPAQLISWPAQEKIKTRSGLGENIGVVYKPKEKGQDEVVYSDCGYYGRKRPTARRGLEHQRVLRKFLGGRLLRENMGMPPEEYWIRSGAKPKFTSQMHGNLLPSAKNTEQGCPPLVKPKKKRVGKPPSKRRDTRCEVEEAWEVPRSSVRRGHGARKSLYKRR
ncbi:enolase-phosphatase E1-like [Heliangelus exortis]|uniref:enolase-phosphatase E1-like n=1 Tax=Heliangelus exortis TaxID=472823 RepID=UPI003A9381DF